MSVEKVKFIIDPGYIPAKELEKIISEYEISHDVSVVYARPRNKSRWSKNNFPEISTSYDEIEEVVQSNKKYLPDVYIDKLISLINDHRTLLLCERCRNRRYGVSLFNELRRIEKMLYGSFVYLNSKKPEFLLLFSTPHHPRVWALAMAAEYISIPVYIVEEAPIPWRYWLISGIDSRKCVPLFEVDKKNKITSTLSAEVEQFIKYKNQSYKDAIPYYEKERIEARGGKYWSWRKEISDHKFHLVSLLKKWRLFKSYYQFVNTTEIDAPYLVFFMHRQPERTSLPEGMSFSQQWYAIRAISLALPPGYRLYVKEHPSTFTNITDERYRHKGFYSDIDALTNTFLLPLEEDTFQLIDNAVAVCTLTGIVGIEALTRGTPVIAFGNPSYRSAPGVFIASNENDISAAINKINLTHNEKDLTSAVRQYLQWVVKNSVSGFEQDEIDYSYYPEKVRIAGHIRLLKRLLDYTKEHQEL
ncbi:capsular polysaccharide export protein, LipB/KpsS family [Thiohalophilus thiocyanatoxydans]|uniref:Capsular polysaccharide biosynthesis protein n=1 Tax=Thiohalophilus thiocyanatoxydans TaxID=381308 RepID=A0A4R8IP45_9GAMM|nr:hypothetical protein [Thiohalophilus thiocyanatoxydans]TDY02681.1 capsular polysaccharide biosynthesis protein [Thiohalophilus thiocyanatoxydans]